MTTGASHSAPTDLRSAEENPVDGSPPAARFQFAEAIVSKAVDQLNPILVKEARQALKSKQFLVTFTLLLACGWGWSLLGIALLTPGVYFAPGGVFMLVGYFLILATPILIVVPFSAFRSLAAEREDGTFELLSITTLSARQIVTGKLGSAILQMLVYYSALAPCVAFTYLLRGVDILSIVILLTTTFLASVLLSAAGLLVATLTSAKHWQVVLSVVLLIGLLWATGVWIAMMLNLIFASGQVPYDQVQFWIMTLSVITFYISFLVLFIQAAAAQLSFASDNRSTRIRWVLLAQQVLWIGWMCYLWLVEREYAYLYVTVSIATLYWFFFGGLLSGELARLSPRVKRSLPQSFLGRMTFTWFNPGSGTGFAFAITNMMGVVLCVAAMGITGSVVAFEGAPNNWDWLLYSGLCLSYLTIYLGVGRLLILLLRQVIPAGIAITLLINVLLAALGALVPVLIQAWIQGYSNLSYMPLQVSNWAWTLVVAVEGNLWAHPVVPPAIFLLAGGVFLLNLLFAMTEVEQVRQETPERVLQEVG